MPPTKVCPQCKAAVPVRQKTCERCDLVFQSKRKVARENSLTMKRMGAVESDCVKSARKAKGKLHKVCERALETFEHGQEQNRMRMASMRESRDSDGFQVNTQVQSHAFLRQVFGTSVPATEVKIAG